MRAYGLFPHVHHPSPPHLTQSACATPPAAHSHYHQHRSRPAILTPSAHTITTPSANTIPYPVRLQHPSRRPPTSRTTPFASTISDAIGPHHPERRPRHGQNGGYPAARTLESLEAYWTRP